MSLREIAIKNYRSIRDLRVELGRATVVAGPNGSGKTNLYRALLLLSAAAEGRLARTLLEEGGMPSVLWAGGCGRLRRKHEPVRLRVEVELPPVHYAIEIGLPGDINTAFTLDPEIKTELVWIVDEDRRRAVVAERQQRTAWFRDGDGRPETYPLELDPAESMLSQLKDPHRFPLVANLCTELAGWRFYHHFRTDEVAPVRDIRSGVRTTVLAPDGADLAAALQTILEIGALDREFVQAIDQAFPGARMVVIQHGDARFQVGMHMPSIKRVLTARELSDGTLRYLCLLVALLTPRAPPLLAINEPEMSLHPDLLRPLGAQIARASRRTQVLVCTHASQLAAAIAAEAACVRVDLHHEGGETRVEGAGSAGEEE